MFNLSDFFRSIFGPFKQELGPNDIPRNIQEDFEERYGWQQPPMNHEGWNVQHGHQDDLGCSEGEFFQEFEQIFQNFFQGFPFGVTPQIQGTPGIDIPPNLALGQPPQEHFPESSESLRKRMLRGPYSSTEMDNIEHEHEASSPLDRFPSFSPFELFSDLLRIPFGGVRPSPNDQMDRDLDNEVQMGAQSLDDILSPRNDHNMPQRCVPPSSTSSFSSVTTIIDSNGVTEQRTTRKKSNGREEVTVTRKIGDQTHTITHRKDRSGNEERHEDLVNIDDDGLADFNTKWDHSKQTGKSPHLSDDSASGHTLLSTIYDSVLEQLFPRR